MKLPDLNSLCLRTSDGELFILDQTRLPQDENWVMVESIEHMVTLIKNLSLRGAPAIGVGAALCLARFAPSLPSAVSMKNAASVLFHARPTAVNLMWAMNRLALICPQKEITAENILIKAVDIFHEDVKLCQEMGRHAFDLINDGENILTHCNTGGLATVGIGTALGAIRYAFLRGKKIHVYIDETRPLLQGGRLTVWECQKLKIPFTLICDNMAAVLMRQGKINRVMLGADRIARNGDFANKIGTYSVSVLARHHGIPFHSVAPYSTIDPQCQSGEQIPIEDRDPEEVRGVKIGDHKIIWAPNAPAFNPSFDVTPVENVTSHILSHGIFTREDLIAGLHLYHTGSS